MSQTNCIREANIIIDLCLKYHVKSRIKCNAHRDNDVSVEKTDQLNFDTVLIQSWREYLRLLFHDWPKTSYSRPHEYNRYQHLVKHIVLSL